MTTTFPSTTPPPIAQTGPVAWVRKNLFSNWFSSLLTLVITGLLLWWAVGFVDWAFGISNPERAARWDVIPKNMALYFVGRYPAAQRWRMWVLFGSVISMTGLTWGIFAANLSRLFTRNVLIGMAIAAILIMFIPVPTLNRVLLIGFEVLLLACVWLGRFLGQTSPQFANWWPAGWLLTYLLILWLLAGNFGLRPVSSNDWGGLVLTLFMAVSSIVLCFPAGVLLALGRRSNLPMIRWICTLFIELVRGVPLIAWLFFGKFIFPDFLPQGFNNPPNLIRAIIVLAMFSAAYLAENVRGGLQSIPRGQTEASQALGLNPFLTTSLIVLPQALKVSIPAIVGQFISLFQDTTLLYVVDVQEMLSMANTVLANPQFLGLRSEVYLFIGVIYWLFCYAMSIASRKLERQLGTGH
jgi:general L-amino acid transport system permease protein